MYLGVEVELPAEMRDETHAMVIEVRYIGRCKDRGGGFSCAYGWIDGWNVILPEEVLREWAHDPYRPGEKTTLYAVLGVTEETSGTELRSAYRQLARAWHPDVCSEPDAAEQFKRIKEAYDILGDPAMRARYDAGLKLQASVPRDELPETAATLGYRSLYNCGLLTVEAMTAGKQYFVKKILSWKSIHNSVGRTLFVGWPVGADIFEERWL